ncbi:MAG: hypothetical protein RQ756_01480 [Flavobacteriaceae bacterium]|nr:hypothetical protein [Flavobacteriaceae bacterium]
MKHVIRSSLMFFGIYALIEILSGNNFNLGYTIFIAIIFGLLFSLFLVGFVMYRLRNFKTREITDEHFSLIEYEDITAGLSPVELSQNLKKQAALKKWNYTDTKNGILIKTGLSLYSLGERISICPISEENGEYTYRISSRPKLKTTRVDYGKKRKTSN